MDHTIWKTSSNPSLEGPYLEINQDYAQVWVAIDSYGRVHHVTDDLTDAERRLQGIKERFRDVLHKNDIRFKESEVIVDGLPGGRNRMLVSFHFSPLGGRWDDQMVEKIVTLQNGYGIRHYKAAPKTAFSKGF